MSSDLLIEDVHFRRKWISPFFIGKKSLRVNLSDLAAMGARAYFVMLDLALPQECLGDFFQGFLRGFLEECVTRNSVLVGGDLSLAEKVSIAVTVCGSIRNGEPVLRSGAAPGDEIFLIGDLGLSRMGLEWLQANNPSGLNQIETETELRRRIASDETFEQVKAHLLPEIQLESGQWLQEQNAASAMIDVSDGLASDLQHVLEESGVSAQLDQEGLDEYQRHHRATPLERILNGGEDYALLFTASPAQSARIEERYPPDLPPRFRIGRIIEGDSILLLGAHGKYEPYHPLGYDHFK